MIPLAAAGLAAGVPAIGLALLVAAALRPLETAAAVLLLAARGARAGRDRGSREVSALVAMAAELRGGAGLRQAVIAAAALLPEPEPVARLATAGRPMGEVAEALAARLGRHGPATAAALRLSSRVGGPLAPLFEELAAQAIDLEEVERERRSAMAPGIAQGIVVGGIPLVALARLVVSGRLVDLAASGMTGAVLAVAGTASTLAGVTLVCVLVWRSGR